MLNSKDPSVGQRVADAIVSANTAVIDCLISCSLGRDQMGAHLMSIGQEVMTVMYGLRKSNVNPVVRGGHWAIFKPRIGSVATLASLASRDFKEADLQKAMQHELPLIQDMAAIQPAVASKIAQANKLVFDAYLICAQERDPVSLMLLGAGPNTDYVDAFSGISKSKMLAAFSECKFPIFSLRHNSGEVMQSICADGFTKPIVIREMLKDSAFA